MFRRGENEDFGVRKPSPPTVSLESQQANSNSLCIEGNLVDGRRDPTYQDMLLIFSTIEDEHKDA